MRKKEAQKTVVIKSACNNYENGFFGTYGADNCVNCGERKAKHEYNMTIKDHVRQFIDEDNALSGLGGKFTGEDFMELEKILSGEADNFIIFNNRGGKAFDVWSHETMKKHSNKATLKGFIDFATSQRSYIYMQKIEGKETIFKQLPSFKKHNDVFQNLVNTLG